MSKAVAELLHQGAIVNCDPLPDQFISRIFLADKPNGKKRFILNLKKLNKFIESPHFKMEDTRTVTRLIHKNCFLATIDLKDAYFLVSVDKADRKFLRFYFDKVLYEFTCLPFGLASAPFAFTKLLKPLLVKLRSQGIICVNYLDDFLIFGDSFKKCSDSIQETISLLTSLGFIINFEKSVLKPSKRCRFLGFIFDTNKLTVELPQDKREKIKRWIIFFIHKKQCRIREFAIFIGLLISACPAIKYGWLYTKQFEREKYLALKLNNLDFNASFTLSNEISTDLSWWARKIDTAFNNIKQDAFAIEIFTDASTSGWGACALRQRARGWWTELEKKEHINWLELRAIFLGLQHFCPHFKNCNILIRTDNTTALAYVNRMGSVKFPKLGTLAKEIWQWCESRNLWIFAAYISSKDNWQADEESRSLPPETEWSLSVTAFQKITNFFGEPEYDLFASKDNRKCTKFVSWFKDSDAITVDAFTLFWGDLNFYAFPPFILILRVLQKIIEDRASGIVVVPFWQSQAWYPLFVKMIVDKPLFFKPSPNLVFSPYSTTPHPLAATLTLVAAKLSGRLLK